MRLLENRFTLWKCTKTTQFEWIMCYSLSQILVLWYSLMSSSAYMPALLIIALETETQRICDRF